MAMRRCLLLALAVALMASGAVAAKNNKTAKAEVVVPAPAPVLDPQALTVPFFNKSKIQVCVSEWTPFVYCIDKAPKEFTGFEVELFRLIMPLMGWSEDMLEWKCVMSFDDMIGSLYNSSGCDISPSGYNPRIERIKKGLKFSVSSLRSGMSIMVSKVAESPGPWYFLSAMNGIVWMAIIVTSIVVGLIVWLFEVGSQSLNADTRWMSNVLWDTVGRPVQMRDYRLASFAANFSALIWSFLVFICMAMYTANLTANLTLTQIKNDIHGLSDLPGKAVGSWSGYSDSLKKHNIAVTPLPWLNSSDELAMVSALKAGYIKALVMPDPVLQILDATECGTMIVGDQFDVFDQATAFSPLAWQQPGLLDAYDTAVLQLLGTGAIEGLGNRFITIPRAPCKLSSVSSASSTSKVTWDMVYGLWIMQAVAVALGCLLVAWHWGWKWLQPRLAKSALARRICCCLGTDRISRSYTSLVAFGHRQAAKPQRGREAQAADNKAGAAKLALDHERGEDELWDERYDGVDTEGGYLDGSADVMEVERRATMRRGAAAAAAAAAVAAAAPAPRTMQRSDTAQRGGGDPPLSARGEGPGSHHVAFADEV